MNPARDSDTPARRGLLPAARWFYVATRPRTPEGRRRAGRVFVDSAVQAESQQCFLDDLLWGETDVELHPRFILLQRFQRLQLGIQ